MSGRGPGGPSAHFSKSVSAEVQNSRGPGQAAKASSLVAACRVRAHLRALQEAGLRSAQIAQLADVPRSTVHRIEEGQQRRVRLDVEARLLAVGPGAAAGVPVAEVQALLDRVAEAGFSRSWVARQLKVSVEALRLRGARVDEPLAEQIRVLATQLLDPDASAGPEPEEVLASHMRTARALGRLDHRWHDQALCSQLPSSVRHLFFSASPPAQALAVQYCQGCPVVEPCLEEAMVTGDGGVRGATTERERRRMRRSREGAVA
jgi:DNA-binding transcriptional ArsR family regulator